MILFFCPLSLSATHAQLSPEQQKQIDNAVTDGASRDRRDALKVIFMNGKSEAFHEAVLAGIRLPVFFTPGARSGR
jgi:hypothetical protein